MASGTHINEKRKGRRKGIRCRKGSVRKVVGISDTYTMGEGFGRRGEVNLNNVSGAISSILSRCVRYVRKAVYEGSAERWGGKGGGAGSDMCRGVWKMTGMGGLMVALKRGLKLCSSLCGASIIKEMASHFCTW